MTLPAKWAFTDLLARRGWACMSAVTPSCSVSLSLRLLCLIALFCSYLPLPQCIGPVDINLATKCAPCLAAPCQNNGTCVSDAAGSYRCNCPYGFKVECYQDAFWEKRRNICVLCFRGNFLQISWNDTTSKLKNEIKTSWNELKYWKKIF